MGMKKYKVIGHCGYKQGEDEIRWGTILTLNEENIEGICPMEDLYPESVAQCMNTKQKCQDCLIRYGCIEEIKE